MNKTPAKKKKKNDKLEKDILIGVFAKLKIIPRNLERHIHAKKYMHTLGCVFAHRRLEKALISLFCLNLRPCTSKERMVRQHCKFTAQMLKACLKTHTKPFSKSWETYWLKLFNKITVQSLAEH